MVDYWSLRREACEAHGLLSDQLDYALSRIVQVAAIATDSYYAAFSISIRHYQIYFETHNLTAPRELVTNTPCYRNQDDNEIRSIVDLTQSEAYNQPIPGSPSASIRAYYGIPILGPGGQKVVGTLAVADPVAKDYAASVKHANIMQRLGRIVEDTLSARREVIRDPLTNLFNRRYTDEFISNEFSSSRRLDLPISVILFDIDHFKQVIDHFGHPFGDRVIEDVARILESCFQRASDTVSRYGGEEFSVIALNTPLDRAVEAAERARKAIEDSALPHPSARCVTVSAGVSVYARAEQLEHIGPEAAFSAADSALYKAKNGGRNRVETHIESPTE